MLSGDEYRVRDGSVREWMIGYHERSETFVKIGRVLPVEVCGEVKGYPIIGPPDNDAIHLRPALFSQSCYRLVGVGSRIWRDDMI